MSVGGGEGDDDGDGITVSKLPRLAAARDPAATAEATVLFSACGKFVLTGGHPDASLKVC